MALNLTTKDRYRKFAGIDPDDTSQDEQLDCLIDAVSERVAKACDRSFELAVHRQWLDGSGDNVLLLPEWPIVELQRVALSGESVGEIKYTGTSKVATVSFETTGLVLFEENTSGTAVRTEVAITSSNKILTDMATTVNTKTGWTMTVDSGEGNRPSSSIRKRQAAWAVNEAIDIDMPFDGVTAEPDEQMERGIRLSGAGSLWPTVAAGAGFPRGRTNVYVQWKAGYTLPVETDTTTGNVPQGLELVVNQIIKDVSDQTKTEGDVAMEKLGDHQIQRSITTRQMFIESAVLARINDLTPYKKIQV